VVLGAIIALLAGLLIAYIYTSSRYGGTVLDPLFKKEKGGGPSAGKHAFDKNSNAFLGVIKSEGYSTRRGADVYYIERAGGQIIEVPKGLVEVRETGKQ
jgi:hypothetical protein